MADVGIRRPLEFEQVFQNLKKFGIAERFTEVVVLAAYAGFHSDRTADGPFEHPVEWQYFTPDERHRLYVLAIAHTVRKEGKAIPDIIGEQNLPQMFKVLERYVHGGLLEMRDKGVFQTPAPEGYGHGLAVFTLEALRGIEKSEEIRVEDLLRDLEAYR
ncbi:hypothetical protein [Corallococcus sp. M7]